MIVYWTAVNSFFLENSRDHALQFINFYEPMKTSDLLNNFPTKDLDPLQNFKYCPSIKKRIQNSYELRFPIDYKLTFTKDGRVHSDMYDQKFFDEVVNIRMAKERLISLNLYYWFIPEKSLEMQSTGSYLSDNEFVNRTIAMPGQFNIYDWIRNIEFAFFMKKGYDEVKINRGDPYLNVKFLTEEPIELKKFYPSDTIINLMEKNLSARTYKTPLLNNMEYYYNLFNKSKIRKMFMKEVLDNLLD
jgi:hypothetical protein